MSRYALLRPAVSGRIQALALAGAVAATVLVPGSLGASAAAAAPGACAPDAGEAGPFYPGPSASAVYNETFRKGAAIPHVGTHMPQGLTVWKDWNGKGDTILLLGAYRPGHDSLLIGIDPASGKHLGSVRVDEAHLGALGVVDEDWLIAQHENGSKVRTYKLSALRKAMKKAIRDDKRPFLDDSGKPQKIRSANFMSTYNGRAWIGDYSRTPGDSKMYQYKVSKKGNLSQVGKSWQVPLSTQGALVTKRHFVFVSGLSTGTVTVTERGERKLANADQRCFTSPSHGQNIVLTGGEVHVGFEGGSVRYAGDPDTRNKITNLHVADRDDLLQLTNP